MVSNESLGIVRVASIHLFVRDLERSRDHYVRGLDFAEVAVSTTSFERQQRARASVLEAGDVRIVLFEPLGCKGESYRFLASHPEGVGRIVLEVADVERVYQTLRRRGAAVISGLERQRESDGSIAWFDIATPIGDTQLRFVQHEGTMPIMPGLARVACGPGNGFGVRYVDHITSNFLALTPAVLWMEHVLGLERYWEIAFHTSDVCELQAGGSGLRSVVMWDPVSQVKFACNEPAAPSYESSQIFTFCEQHRGPGVQHIALAVHDIVAATRGMRARGVEFMRTPPAYFDRLPARLAQLGIEGLEERYADLRELEILVDAKSGEGYLLQIFMREAAALLRDPQAGPLFIELIQRRGDQGFGAGNFRALFESVEREQKSHAA